MTTARASRGNARRQMLSAVVLLLSWALTTGCGGDKAPVQADAATDAEPIDVATDTADDADGADSAATVPTGDVVTLKAGQAELVVDRKALTLHLRFAGAERTRIDLQKLRLGRVPALDPDFNYNPSNLQNDPPEKLEWLQVAGADWAPAAEPGVALRLHTTVAGQPGPDWLLGVRPGSSEYGLFQGALGPDGATADGAATLQETAKPQVVYTDLRVTVGKDEAFYGLGEYFDTPEHRGKVRQMQIEVDAGVDSGYNEAHVPVPFVVGTKGWGLFVENRRPAIFDVAASQPDEIQALFHDAVLPFHLFAAAHPLEVPQLYTRVTGAPSLPAKWAFGGLLWRDENEDQAEVEDDAAQIRQHDLALSGMWIDRPYDTHVNNFEFDPEMFQDPKAMIAQVHAKGLRMGLWSTPYVEEGAKEHAKVKQNGWFVDVPAVGQGLMKWGPPLDLTNPDVQAFWKQQIKKMADLGIEGWKLDYAEDVQLGILTLRVHFGFFDGSDERTMHHGYMPFYHRPYAESLPKDGGWILSRAGTYGDQIYSSIIWPGDLCANWAEHRECDDQGECHTGGLPASVSAAMSLAASGFPLFGADTGGYKHGRATKELFLRWLQHTALSGILQIGGGSQHNPWDFAKYGDSQFDGQVLEAARYYIRLHARLFPYLYTDAVRAHEHAGPGPVRAFGLVHPELATHPAMALREKDQYYLGDALLVAPIVKPGNEREVLLPAGAWVDWWTHEPVGLPTAATVLTVQQPIDRGPLFIRAGALIPLLRPTIDTLAPATELGIESFANDVGRLHVLVVPPVDTAEHGRAVYDGTQVTQTRTAEGTLSLRTTPGQTFTKGVEYEIWLAAAPVAVNEADLKGGTVQAKPLTQTADAAQFATCQACWRFDAQAGVLHVRPGAADKTVLVTPQGL